MAMGVVYIISVYISVICYIVIVYTIIVYVGSRYILTPTPILTPPTAPPIVLW